MRGRGGRGSPARTTALLGLASLLGSCELGERAAALEVLAEFVGCADGAAARAPPHDGCTRGLYLRSPSMPLSGAGEAEARAASEALGVTVRALDAAVLTGAPTDPREASGADLLALDLIAAGATAHYPALVLYRGGERLGPAILGYRTAEAYTGLLRERLGRPTNANRFPRASLAPWARAAETRVQAVTDYPVSGRPGAYFRWVPGTRAVAYEAGSRVFLLDLDSGEQLRAPGTIDFVPTPDGRLFVTPGSGRRGLEFYDARAVQAAADRGEGAAVQPVFADREMRDQYPSAGILRTDESAGRVVYRILTSWYAGVVYRDYEVSWPERGGPRVRPLGSPVPACADRRVSLPIMTQDGRELAGRDERTGTTKLYALAAGGRCTELLDLGIPTTKVAFDRSGRRFAFAVPPRALRDGVGRSFPGVEGAAAANYYGVYLYDRDRRRIERVPGSEEAVRLTIPEMVGDEGVIFLLSGAEGGASRFRFVRLRSQAEPPGAATPQPTP